MKKIILSYGVLMVLALCLAGCTQPVMNLVETEPHVYSLELSINGNSVDTYSTVVFAGEQDTYRPAEITVTNTGNRRLTGLQLKEKDNNGDFGIDALPSRTLEPNESITFQVVFEPWNSSQVGPRGVEILAGNSDASKIVKLEYTAYELEELEYGKVITLTPTLFQVSGTGPYEVTTDDTSKTGDSPWLSSNPDVAYFEGDDLIVTGPGETVFYFVTDEEDYKAKGKKVTVYPAKETLNPVYPLEDGFVAGVDSGAPVLPANLGAINAAAGEDGVVAFSLPGGSSVISAIDPASGALTFSGSEGETEEVTVTLTITKTTSDGILTTHSGSVTFTAKIVPPKPGPAIQSAVIDGAIRADAKKLVITWDKALELTNLDGFSINNETQGAFSFTGHTVLENTLTITLGREPSWSEIQAEALTLTYNAGTGNVEDTDGNPGQTANNVSITMQNFDAVVYTPPVVAAENGIVLDGADPTHLVITWDKNIDSTSGFAGFTLQAGTETITFSGASVHDAKLTLTMNRAPNRAEAQGDLTLSYNASNSGPVKDLGGSAAETFTGKTVTVTNVGQFLAAPVLQSAVINATAPTTLALTFDQAVQAASSAGFAISGSETATSFVTDITGSGTTTLTLTLNRKPAYGESVFLSYNQSAGNVALAADFTLGLSTFIDTTVTLDGFTDTNDSRPTVVSVAIDADSDEDHTSTPDEAKIIYVTYDKAVQAPNYTGFSVSGSTTALDIQKIEGTGTSTLALTLNDWPSASEEGNFTLSYDMDLGNVCDNNDNLALSFSEKVEFENYLTMGDNIDTAPPRLVSATVENSDPSVVRVVFNEPVTVDKSKFIVKVNKAVPRTSMAAATNGILMDVQKELVDREIRNVVVVPGSNDRIWDMTMDISAVHGEVLRLATNAAGAAQDLAKNAQGVLAPNSLPEILQFIVSNKVKRVKGTFESTAGFYKNGSSIDLTNNGTITVSSNKLYQAAIQYLTKRGSYSSIGVYPAGNDVYTIVLDTDQIVDTDLSFSATHIPVAHMAGGGSKYIITTSTGTDITITNEIASAVFQGRNGTVLVIDEHIVFQQKSGVELTGGLIQMMDGGSIIMDGGVIRNSVSQRPTAAGNNQNNDIHAAGIRIGGGSYGGYLIINGGKITNNYARFGASPASSAETNGGAGGVIVMQYGVIIMNGGEISNNTLDVNGMTPRTALAGGIMGNTGSNQRHANASFFMTGGEIFGNKVIGSTAVMGSAGGVYVSGTFQKNGGTIYGADGGDSSRHNTTTLTGNKASAIFVSNEVSANPGGTSVKREHTAGPDVTLFVESLKTSTSTKGQNTVPTWATSFWDE
jgi:hypothetical protein